MHATDQISIFYKNIDFGRLIRLDLDDRNESYFGVAIETLKISTLSKSRPLISCSIAATEYVLHLSHKCFSTTKHIGDSHMVFVCFLIFFSFFGASVHLYRHNKTLLQCYACTNTFNHFVVPFTHNQFCNGTCFKRISNIVRLFAHKLIALGHISGAHDEIELHLWANTNIVCLCVCV